MNQGSYKKRAKAIEKISLEKETVDRIKIRRRAHVLLPGKVQSGKLRAMLELTARVQREHPDKAVLILFRSHRADYIQCEQRIKEFNRSARYHREKPISPPHDLCKDEEGPDELIRSGALMLGLCNKPSMEKLKACLDANQDLKDKLVVILDEADLATMDLNPADQTKTEKLIRKMWDEKKIYMIVSVTATPMSILWCDKITQVAPLPKARNYYGLANVVFHACEFVRESKDGRNYRPDGDHENLSKIMKGMIELGGGTALLSTSRIIDDHKATIEHLIEEYGYLGESLVYFEVNEQAVKVYSHDGELIALISRKMGRHNVCAVDKALQEFIHVPYIVIVAGVLSGRGISFVSTDRERHLTHQYIACAKTTHLEAALQQVRALGRYDDNPTLHLYCATDLYLDLMAQDRDMDNFIMLAEACARGKKALPDVVRATHEYRRKWLPLRKSRGGGRMQTMAKAENQYKYPLVAPNTKANRERIRRGGEMTLMRIADNYSDDVAGDVLNDNDHLTYRTTRKGKKGNFQRAIAFDTLEEIQALEKARGRKFKHYASVKALYEKHPEYAGTIRRRERAVVQQIKNVTAFRAR